MAETLPHPFGEEIKGIAAVSGVPLGNKSLLLSTPSAVNRPPGDLYRVSEFQAKSSCSTSSMRCSQCARRSSLKIKRVGRVPPSGRFTEPTGFKIWALLLFQVTCFMPGTWILGYLWGKSVLPPPRPPGSTVFGVLVRI